MGTRQHKWRSSQTVYVDSIIGDDMTGDGSIYKPYQSWYRACFHNQPTVETPTSIPNIVLKGIHTGHMPFGYCTTVNGSAWGEAIYDGQDTYAIYGFFHNNLIIRRTRSCTDTDPVRLGSHIYAGVGAPYSGTTVGYANYVAGVGGSSVLVDRCVLYWGCAVTDGRSSIIFSRLRHNYVKNGSSKTGFKIALGGRDATTSQSIFHSCDIKDRRRINESGDTSLTAHTFFKCLFAGFDMWASDSIKLNQCFFTSDTGWYFVKDRVLYKIVIDETISSEDTTITLATGDAVSVDINYDNVGTATIGGGTVATFIATAIAGGATAAKAKASAIPTAIDALRAVNYITSKPTFTNCKFSDQTTADTFNNPAVDKNDFTLKLSSDAVEGAYVTGSGSKQHYGALPPSLNIPIMSDSDGTPGTWDERSFSGLLKIDGDKISIDTTSNDTDGEGRTKVISLNSLLTADKALSSVFAEFGSKFKSHGIVFWNAWDLLDRDNKIALTSTAQTLTKGIANAPAYYLIEGDSGTRVKVTVNGDILEGNDALKHGQVIMVDSNSTVTAVLDSNDGGTTAYLIPVLDSNMPDAIEVRMQEAVYAQAESGSIKARATYLNSGATTITYNGHQVVTGESFVGVTGETTFTGAASGYKVDVIFDDDEETPLVPAAEWIPACFWGTYFCRVNDATNKQKYYLGWSNDTTPTTISTSKGTGKAPASSGNPLAYVTTTGTPLYMGEKFLQFRLKCKKIFYA